MVVRSFDGKVIQEGVYLDAFGKLVHVKAREDQSFEYRDQSSSGYITLGGYAKMLMARISNPDEAKSFLEDLAQNKPSIFESFRKNLEKELGRKCEPGEAGEAFRTHLLVSSQVE